MSRRREQVITIPIDPEAPEPVSCSSDVTPPTERSQDSLRQALTDVDRRGRPLDILAIDADHPAAAVGRDLEPILAYMPREAVITLMPKSGYRDTRGSIRSVDWMEVV